jgi:hypothetical protein
VEAAAKLAELETNGLEGAVLSAATPLFYCELDREPAEALCRARTRGLAAFCRFAPTRFRWMAHIPIKFPGLAVLMLDEATREAAVAVEQYMAERRLNKTTIAIERLNVSGVLDRHPRVQVVLVRSGG